MTARPEGFAELRAGIISLLEHRQIRHVIIVDDRPPSSGVETVIAAIIAESKIPKWARDKMPRAAGRPDEVVRDDVQRAWDGLEHHERVKLVRDLMISSARTEGSSDAEPVKQHELFSAGIEALFPEGMVRWIFPEEWKRERDHLVRASVVSTGGSRYCNTMFLFDRDLGIDHGATAGEDYAIELLQITKGLDVTCGVISNALTPGEEGTVAIPAASGIEPHRIVRISKRKLADEPRYFAYGLKKTVIAPYVDNLRDRASALIEEAHRKATEELRRIDPFDFAYAVIRRSDTDGEHELDTFLRLSHAYVRKGARRAVREDVALRDVSAKLREVSGMAENAVPPKEHSVWQLQRKLTYENADDLNGLRLPITLGDIFEIEDLDANAKRYMLLGQPCDLAIRGNGKRKATTALLVRARDRQAGDGTREGLAHLSYHQVATGEWGVVDFWDVRSIPICILDATAYHPRGRASIDLARERPPEGLPLGAERRYPILLAEMARVAAELAAHDSIAQAPRSLAGQENASDRRELDEADVPVDAAQNADKERSEGNDNKPTDDVAARTTTERTSASEDELFGREVLAQSFVRASVDGTIVSFQIMRVDRLLGPYAADVLTHFAQHLSRPALDVDLAANTRNAK
jgi:hypothetical protein